MAISNTIIAIKRSGTTGRPSTLNAGELAYSYVSNTAFIGTASGGVANVGGQFYTSQIDAATNLGTASTIVKRDTNNAFIGNLYGNANTANTLATARNFSIGGAGEITASAVSFDGSGNVVLSANLNNSGASAGTYGSGTLIPQITVDAHGRVTSITTVSNPGGGGISAVTMGFSNTATGTPLVTVAGGNTLNLFGSAGGGITTAISAANGITFAVDTSVARTGVSQTFTGNQTFSNDVSISGNLTVLGTQTTINTASLEVRDSLIYLANGNFTSDLLDIGFVGHYMNASSINVHAGMVRSATTKDFIVFQNYTTEPGNQSINIADPSFALANISAQIFKGNVSGNIATFSGAVTAGSFSGAGTGLTGTASGLTANIALYTSTTEVNTGTLYPKFGGGLSGNLADVANNAISLNAATGTLTVKTLTLNTALAVGSGGTGQTSFTANGIIYGNGTGALGSTSYPGGADITYSNQILTVTSAGVPAWSSTMDGGSF